MKPKVYTSSYELDDSLDTIRIIFNDEGKGYYSEIDFGQDVNSFAQVLFREDHANYNAIAEEEITWIEIVNPQPFMNAESTDEFEINGFNIKRLIREEMEKAS